MLIYPDYVYIILMSEDRVLLSSGPHIIRSQPLNIRVCSTGQHHSETHQIYVR